jgi:uncharacterized protein (TIGR02118 family)
MIIRMGLLNKRPEWTEPQFHEYWRYHHGPLAAQLPGLRSYVQNHVTDRLQRGIQFKRGPEQLDGISALAFDDVAAMSAALASPFGTRLPEDEARLLGRLRIVAVERADVIEPDPNQRLVKRMSLLRRRPDVDASTFEHEWRIEHARLVRAMPGVLGYRQNLVTERQAIKGVPCSYEALPIDGIVELWFASTDAIDRAFSSPEGVTTMRHATTFIDEITTFMVDSTTIV